MCLSYLRHISTSWSFSSRRHRTLRSLQGLHALLRLGRGHIYRHSSSIIWSLVFHSGIAKRRDWRWIHTGKTDEMSIFHGEFWGRIAGRSDLKMRREGLAATGVCIQGAREYAYITFHVNSIHSITFVISRNPASEMFRENFWEINFEDLWIREIEAQMARTFSVFV